jgi:hypothetical protein
MPQRVVVETVPPTSQNKALAQWDAQGRLDDLARSDCAIIRCVDEWRRLKVGLGQRRLTAECLSTSKQLRYGRTS